MGLCQTYLALPGLVLMEVRVGTVPNLPSIAWFGIDGGKGWDCQTYLALPGLVLMEVRVGTAYLALPGLVLMEVRVGTVSNLPSIAWFGIDGGKGWDCVKLT